MIKIIVATFYIYSIFKTVMVHNIIISSRTMNTIYSEKYRGSFIHLYMPQARTSRCSPMMTEALSFTDM